jgi:hypothetical protein
VVDLDEAEQEAPDAEPGYVRPCFLMLRGAGGKAAVSMEASEEAAAAQQAATALEELMGLELARLAKLASALP